MILVSGASGKTGKAILNKLSEKGAAVRAWVRREEQRQTMLDLGAKEVFVGDLHSAADWQTAVDGVEKVYFICPNMTEDEDQVAEMAIQACEAAGVQRFVYHSVLHPQVSDMPHHWGKLLVEERLFKSSLAFTILQPAAYMQNVLAYKESIQRDGVYRIPYSVQSKSSMVDLNDLAEAAAKVLTEAGHEHAIYELCGLRAYSAEEIAAIIGEKSGLAVKAETQPYDEWEAIVRKKALPNYAVETLLKMFHYYEDYHFIGNGMVLSWLLGRAPASFEDFAENNFRA